MLNRTVVLIGIALYAVTLGGWLLSSLADEIKWGYEGEDGPSRWGRLSPEFALCDEGSAQSPIDIRDAIRVELVEIEFQYGEFTGGIVNNGHTIQVDVDPGSSIIYNGITYDLLQFHFHSPSEHTIDGEAAPMELHLVHKDRHSDALAVVGVLIEEAEAANAAYAPVLDAMPSEIGAPEALEGPLDLVALLPETRGYYTYQGSLTTPPCSEIVRWLLLDTPVALSVEQLAAYSKLYSGNARPVQPLGQRDLLHRRA